MSDDYSILKNYKNTRFAKELVNQLIRIPTLYAFEHNQEQCLFRTLYCALSDHGKYYDYFLPNQGFLGLPLNYDNVNERTFNKIFYLDQKNNQTHGHLNHICSITIPTGKMVYNCYDCGVDSTCCLCEHCFNKEEHSDHNVSVHTSNGNAICDCGDKSSWNVNLNCMANLNELKLKNSLPGLPHSLELHIKVLLRVLFDYLLDVHLTNVTTLPTIKNDDEFLNAIHNIPNIQTFDDQLAKETYKYDYIPFNRNEDIKENTIYTSDFLDYKYLIVWNDEFHNYDEAKRFLSSNQIPANNHQSDDFPYYEFTYDGKSNLHEKYDIVTSLAKTIDEKGYVCYARSKDVSKLQQKIEKFEMKQRQIRSSDIGLTYSILTGKEYSNLIMTRSIINWLDVIIKNRNVILTDFIKHELSIVLFENSNFHLKQIPIFEKYKNLPYSLNEYLQIPLIKEVEKKIDSVENLSNIANRDKTILRLHSSSRLQYLIFFEMRYPKSMRIKIKKTIIPILTNTMKSRFEFAKQVLEYLPTYELNIIKFDREWELSILETFRLQIYHDPNLGTILLESLLVENIIDSILLCFKESNPKCITDDNKFIYLSSTFWKDKRTRNCLFYQIQGFDTLLNFIQTGKKELFTDSFFTKILRLLIPFDECIKIYRKIGDHEEYQNERIIHGKYSVLLPIYSIIRSLGKIVSGINEKNSQVEKAIILLATYLRKDEPKAYSDIIPFNITTDGASVVHPIGSLISAIAKNYKFFNPKILLNTSVSLDYSRLSNDFTNLYEIKSHPSMHFTFCADKMLQAWVLSSQIKSNFWIRNGVDAYFASGFFDLFEPSNNIFVLQSAILLDELPIDYICDRYLLSDCIRHVSSFENTIYEEKIAVIIDEFLLLMYYILTLRIFNDSTLTFVDKENFENKFKMIIKLAKSPMRYSILKNEFHKISNLDEILNEIATYLPPQSYNDYGHYTLKEEYWDKIDPFDYFVDKSSFSELEESLLKNLSNNKHTKLNDVIITPYIYPLIPDDLIKFKKIGDYMKTSKFVKILYTILRFALDSEHDSYLNIALHLIHAIILDDELYNKDRHGLKSFIDIPICNLLLSISEKPDLPKYITKKSSTILEILLLKDDNILVSLLDCFGTEHIEQYKKSKHGKNLETKTERKKRLALKRQKKVLQKMMRQQTDFVENNKTFFDDETDNNNSGNDNGRQDSTISDSHLESNSGELRTCVLCKNSESNDLLFGTPGLITASSDFWTIPAIDDQPPEFMVKEFNELSKNIKIPNKFGFSGCTREKLVINGCPHGMHFKCFNEMLAEKDMKCYDFNCPLCKGKFNSFIPSFKLNESEVDPNTFEPINYTESLINDSIYGENISVLTNQIFDKSVFRVLSDSNNSNFKTLMKEIIKLNKENIYIRKALPKFKVLKEKFYQDLKEDYYLQFSMSLLIGSTLEMEEISSRKNSNTFISEILSSTLKSMLQYRILNNYEPTKGESQKKKYFEFLVHNPHLGFVETTMLLFIESGFPLVDCIKFSFIKRIVFISLSLVQRYDANENNLNFDSILDNGIHELNEKSVIYKSIETIFENVIEQLTLIDGEFYSVHPIFIQKLYKILKTNFKIYQRQIDYISLFLNTLPIDNNSGKLLPDVDEILIDSFKDATVESKFRDILINNIKIGISEKDFEKSHRRDEFIDFIEYPKPIHLIDLPEKLKDIALIGLSKGLKPPKRQMLAGKKSKKNKAFDHICLHCGQWLNMNIPYHRLECKLSSFFTIIFTPLKNQLDMYLPSIYTSAGRRIESPYLNKHGEPSEGMIGNGDSGTLNVKRYEYLQKSCFNQTVISKYLTTERVFGFVIRNTPLRDDRFIPGIFERLNGTNNGRPRSQDRRRNGQNEAIARMLGLPVFFENANDEDEEDPDYYDDNDIEDEDEYELPFEFISREDEQFEDVTGTETGNPNNLFEFAFPIVGNGEEMDDEEYVLNEDINRAEFLRRLLQRAQMNIINGENNPGNNVEEEEREGSNSWGILTEDYNENEDEDFEGGENSNEDEEGNVTVEGHSIDYDNSGDEAIHNENQERNGYFSDNYDSENDEDYYDAMEVDDVEL